MTPDPSLDVPRQVVALLTVLGWTEGIPPEAGILDLYRRLRQEGTYIGNTAADIAGYIAGHITTMLNRQRGY